MSTQEKPSHALGRVRHSGNRPQPRQRVLLVLLGMALLVVTLGRSVSWPLLAPPSHSAEHTNCSACHDATIEGNEEGADEGEGLADNQAGEKDMAEGTGRIEGYASASSVPQGASIDFHISAQSGVTAYDLAIFRAGADEPEPITTIPDLPARSFSCGPVAAVAGQESRDLGCDWPVAYTLQVPPGWPSGLYVAAMLDEDDRLSSRRYASYIPFIVTEDQPGSTSDILFQFSTNTWQAYNQYEGWSFYTDPRAHLITFDRPYGRCTLGDGASSGCRFKWEIPLARWLESEGYTVEYASNEDIHADPALLFNYNLLLSVGHDEYWSKEIRDHIDAFIDVGGNVAIFSGNTAYRQVRYQEGMRTLVCYMFSDRRLDPLYGVDNLRVASRFRLDPVFWPQNSTTGLGYRTGGYVNNGGTGTVGRYTVYRSDHWVYQNTGLQDGDRFWYELDNRVEVDGTEFTWQSGLPMATGADDTPANLIILGLQQSTLGHAIMAIYTRDGGGTVFNAATMGWARGLWPSNNPQDYEIARQITRNVLDTLSSRDGPINRPPRVDAGPDQTVSLVSGAVLDGTVQDDGLPGSPGSVTILWSQASGPGTVTFENTGAADTTASFSEAGEYVLRLTADDGELSASDEVTITVQAEPENQRPVVDAGGNQEVVLPDGAVLDGTVEDDGLPDPPGAVTVEWSQASGPGEVTFADARAVDTKASFSQAGEYVLRLTADDGELLASDEVTITASSYIYVPLMYGDYRAGSPVNPLPVAGAGSD